MLSLSKHEDGSAVLMRTPPSPRRKYSALPAASFARYKQRMIWVVVVVAGLAAAASALGTGIALRVVRERAILDHPNNRSSHAAPTPTGGGIAVVAVILFDWLLIWGLTGAGAEAGFTYPVPLLCLLAAVLAAVSWYDDLKGLGAVNRLIIQAAVVLIAISTLSAHGRIFQGMLPYGLDVVVTAYIWLWFVNLTNFMDGIDGITGVESGSIGIGIAILAPAIIAAGVAQDIFVSSSLALYATVLAAAAIGFLVWNWQPAKIFLGDVGAIPLGFLGGWLLLEAAGSGLWVVAILLPLYYLADATITLAMRLARREAVLQAHRSHFYQRAARAIGAHAPVTLAILALNIVFIALAIVSAAQPANAIAALIAGGVLTLGLLWYFAGRKEQTGGSEPT
jgi:UDP-N-acetylmuramyl pentapeptide phosphotransferase/UDP-N-acetylglucosamine-1-phosphate transferase